MSGTMARYIFLGVLALAVSSCSSTSYIVDWDSQSDFSGYRSYAWFERAPSKPGRGQPPNQANAIMAGRILRSLDGEMELRGLDKRPAGKSDLLVTYYLVINSRMVMYHTGWSYPVGRWGWGWGWYGGGWGLGRSSLQTVTEGTLVVDVLDSSSRSLVWRGVAERAFSKPNPTDQRVAKVVARLMRDFPPLTAR
jgi:hypothetical protein